VIWLITVAIASLSVGFVTGMWLGVRYTTNKLLPIILAKMPVRELASVAKQASKLREVDEL
jgi:hypothetical protein